MRRSRNSTAPNNSSSAQRRINRVKSRGPAVVTSAPQVGVPYLMDTTELPYVIADLEEAGVAVRPLTIVTAIDGTTVHLESVYGSATSMIEADTVVLNTGYVANDELFCQLEAAGLPVVAAGDSIAPRRLQLAVYDGYMAGFNVG